MYAWVHYPSRPLLAPSSALTNCISFCDSYAGTHSTDVTERKQGLERAYPVTVGDDVWIGGGAIIVGPCTIGNGEPWFLPVSLVLIHPSSCLTRKYIF